MQHPISLKHRYLHFLPSQRASSLRGLPAQHSLRAGPFPPSIARFHAVRPLHTRAAPGRANSHSPEFTRCCPSGAPQPPARAVPPDRDRGDRRGVPVPGAEAGTPAPRQPSARPDTRGDAPVLRPRPRRRIAPRSESSASPPWLGVPHPAVPVPVNPRGPPPPSRPGAAVRGSSGPGAVAAGMAPPSRAQPRRTAPSRAQPSPAAQPGRCSPRRLRPPSAAGPGRGGSESRGSRHQPASPRPAGTRKARNGRRRRRREAAAGTLPLLLTAG